MNKMNNTIPQVARSPRDIRHTMLRANRFMGLHQAWWGLALTPPALYLGDMLAIGDWRWWWPLAAFLVAWAGVELCFLPRRLVIHKLADKESHAEAVRLAWMQGLSIREVMAPRRHRFH